MVDKFDNVIPIRKGVEIKPEPDMNKDWDNYVKHYTKQDQMRDKIKKLLARKNLPKKIKDFKKFKKIREHENDSLKRIKIHARNMLGGAPPKEQKAHSDAIEAHKHFLKTRDMNDYYNATKVSGKANKMAFVRGMENDTLFF